MILNEKATMLASVAADHQRLLFRPCTAIRLPSCTVDFHHLQRRKGTRRKRRLARTKGRCRNKKKKIFQEMHKQKSAVTLRGSSDMNDYHEEDQHDVVRKRLEDLSNPSPNQNPDDCVIDEDVPKIFGDLEKILGDDPSQRIKKEVNLHQTLVKRWKDWIVTGFSKEVLDELTTKYPRIGNCNLEAPALNLEVMHSLKETAQKRDRHFVNTQNLAGTALSAVGMAITCLLREEGIDKLKLLELLSDAAKLLIEVHHKESSTRIAYILPGMGKQIKAVLEESKPDTLLFGHGLTEKLQEAIALEKLGKELKASQKSPMPKKQNPRPPGNSKWKNSGQWQPGSGHMDNRSTAGPNRNYQQKPRQTSYHTGPLRQQNQGRSQNNRSEVHRRS